MTLAPPDGGWGWVVVVGCSIMNLSTRSIEPSFGLLFGELLKDLGIAMTGASVIVSTLDALINFSGLFVGPIMKKYSFRKMAILGAVLSALGLISTSYAASLTHILITYSVIGGLGFGLVQASAFLALNIYFLRKRGQAVGLAMTGTSVGFMVMPQLVSVFLEEYGFQNSLLLLGALSLNAVVGASVLQPVKWHMKPVIHKSEYENKLIEKEEKNNGASKSLLDEIKHDQEANVSSGYSTRSGTNLSILPHDTSRSSSVGSQKRKTSTLSDESNIDFIDGATNVNLETASENGDSTEKLKDNISDNDEAQKTTIDTSILQPNTQKPKHSYWNQFVYLMDLDLLLDVKFLNIIFGVSISYVAELNFKLIVPFFLENLGFSKRETAKALSIMAIADIAARATVPTVLDRLGVSKKKTFLVTLIILCVSRSVVAEQTTWGNLIGHLIFHGFVRGISMIHMPLVVSEYITMTHKLPAAFGLSMVGKGIFIVVLGPFSGWVRDYTESYSVSLHLQSAMMASCCIAWIAEYIICFNKNRKKINQPC